MKPFETLFSQKFCDHCHSYSDSLIQSKEGNWLCPVCEDTHKCDVCGDISDEVTMSDTHLCFNCVGLSAEDFDIIPIVKLMSDSITKLNHIN